MEALDAYLRDLDAGETDMLLGLEGILDEQEEQDMRRRIEQRLRLTAVTGFELRMGADFLARREILRLFRSRTVPLDLASALRGGQVAAGLRASGQVIGFAESLQAGICLHHDLPFATRNRRHFDRIPGMRLTEFDSV